MYCNPHETVYYGATMTVSSYHKDNQQSVNGIYSAYLINTLRSWCNIVDCYQCEGGPSLYFHLFEGSLSPVSLHLCASALSPINVYVFQPCKGVS